MDFLESQRLIWIIGIPWLGMALILLARNKPNLREVCTLLASLTQFVLAISVFKDAQEGVDLKLRILLLVPHTFLEFRADHLGVLFSLLSSFLWLVTSIYSIGYMRVGKYIHQTSYFAFFALCLSATSGIAFAANLLTFFVFYELLTLATYPLVVHFRSPQARNAGRKYLFYTLAAGQCLLLGLLWIHTLDPKAVFQPGGFLSHEISHGTLKILFLLLLLGVGVKAAIVPLHAWLPSAMVAPTPVSALLHAVAVVKAGVFGVLRIVGYVFGVDLIQKLGLDSLLIAIACVTILYGSLRALQETNLKRRLAFSTISQLSYIVLGAGLGSVYALAGAIFHIVAHALMKITLFFVSGVLQVTANKRDVRELAGAGHRMSISMAAFSIAALGMAGIPLLPGFISKWNLGLGALKTGHPIVVLVLIASGLLNIGYFFPIIYDAFFKTVEAEPIAKRPSALLWFPTILTGLLALLLGMFPNLGFSFYDLAWSVAKSIAGGK